MKKNNVLIKNIADLQDSFFCKKESHKSLGDIIKEIENKLRDVKKDDLPFLEEVICIDYKEGGYALFDLLDYYTNCLGKTVIRYEFNGTAS